MGYNVESAKCTLRCCLCKTNYRLMGYGWWYGGSDLKRWLKYITLFLEVIPRAKSPWLYKEEDARQKRIY